MRSCAATFAAVVLIALAPAGPTFAGVYDEIIAAADLGQTDVVLKLIGRGLDANTASADGTTLLMMAARNGNLALVEALLKQRANHLMRNRFGDTALMLAALNGHLGVVRRLIELRGPQENRDGWTPLHYAAFSGHVEVAQLLVERGAAVDAPAPNSQTALMLAAGAGHLPMVAFLLGEQANPALRDHSGMTARAIAQGKGQTDVAEYLRRIGMGE